MVISVFRVPRVIREDPSANSAENRLIDFLEASWHGNRADYSSPNRGGKKKERKNENLPPPLHFTTPPPISRAPSIKLDRSGSLPREANSIRVSCDRVKSTPRCEIGSWIIDSVACIVKGIEEWFPDFPAIFRFRKFFVSSNRLHPPLILRFRISLRIMSKLSSMFRFSRV